MMIADKGKVICVSCNEHIWNLIKPIYDGEIAIPNILVNPKTGESDIDYSSKIECPKCGELPFINTTGMYLMPKVIPFD